MAGGVCVFKVRFGWGVKPLRSRSSRSKRRGLCGVAEEVGFHVILT